MKQVIWVIVVLLVIWGVYALANNKSTPAPEQGTQPIAEGSAETTTPAVVNAIDAADQKPGKAVMVASYTLSAPGFIEVHAVNAQQAAGDILGSSELLAAGTATNLTISLATALKDGEKVIVMLHLDTDVNGKFDGAIDMPATAADATGAQAVVMKMVSVKK